MKKIGLVFSVLMLLLTFAIQASAQQYSEQPCESRKKRVAKNAIVGSGLGALIGAITGGGKGAAIGAAVGGGAGAASGIPNQSGCDNNARNENRERNDNARQPERVDNNMNMPDLRGQLVAVRFEQMDGLSQLVQNRVFQELARRGARPIRQAPGFWQTNPCQVPGENIVCITVGTAVMLTNSSGSSNTQMGFGGVYTSNGDSSQDQLYVVSVQVDLYENPEPVPSENGWQQQQPQPLVTALATAEGIGDARSGSNYMSTSASRFGMSTTTSQYGSYQLAGMAAANQAISKLLRGDGWFPEAGEYLRGD